MRVLVLGATGYVGSRLVPHLVERGHEVVAASSSPPRPDRFGWDDRVRAVQCDVTDPVAVTEVVRDVDAVVYLVHSLDRPDFPDRDRVGARTVADAVADSDVSRLVYLSGLVPDVPEPELSAHIASRLEVERILVEALPGSTALRASIVIGARSRSFRFLVNLVSRVPVLPMPPWTRFRTQPIDGRDMLEFLARAATEPAAGGRSLDIAGPDVVTYGEMLSRIADHMLVSRPGIGIPVTMNGVASRVAAAIAGEDPGLIEPLMGSLGADILPRDDAAAKLLGVRLHGFDRAVERALREWESLEPGSVAAR